MARIVGVDLPSNKRGEIALTYIYGIGRSSARAILSEAGIDYDLRSDEHQTTDGYRLLPGYPSPFRTARKRTEHEEQCPYT